MNDFLKSKPSPKKIHAELDKALKVTQIFCDQLAQTPVGILRHFSAGMEAEGDKDGFDDFLSFLIEQRDHFQREILELIPCTETMVNTQASGFKTSIDLDKNMLNTLKILFQVRTKIQQAGEKNGIEIVKKVSTIVAAIEYIHRNLQRVFDPNQNIVLEPQPDPEVALSKRKLTTTDIEWLFQQKIITDPQSLYLTCLALTEYPLSAKDIAIKLGIKGPKIANGQGIGSTLVAKNIGVAIKKANKALEEKNCKIEICRDDEKRMVIYVVPLGK